MEVVVTNGSIKRVQSNHHHQQTKTPSFLQAGCPSCHLTNRVKALKGNLNVSVKLCALYEACTLQLLHVTRCPYVILTLCYRDLVDACSHLCQPLLCISQCQCNGMHP